MAEGTPEHLREAILRFVIMVWWAMWRSFRSYCGVQRRR